MNRLGPAFTPPCHFTTVPSLNPFLFAVKWQAAPIVSESADCQLLTFLTLTLKVSSEIQLFQVNCLCMKFGDLSKHTTELSLKSFSFFLACYCFILKLQSGKSGYKLIIFSPESPQSESFLQLQLTENKQRNTWRQAVYPPLGYTSYSFHTSHKNTHIVLVSYKTDLLLPMRKRTILKEFLFFFFFF